MPTAVHVHLQLRIVGDDGTVFTDSEILRLEKSDHRLEAVGLSIGESKSLQNCLQHHIRVSTLLGLSYTVGRAYRGSTACRWTAMRRETVASLTL